MANPKHVEMVKQGADAIVAWCKAHPGERLDLGSADLEGVNLAGANLEGADLKETYLTGAILNRANLRSANLQGANLESADLQGAHLEGADLQGTDLTHANLSRAHIDRRTHFDNMTIDHTTKGLASWVLNPEHYIIREIEFPPESHQAGVSILNYFATVLRQTYPDIPAIVQTTQDMLTVRMTIEIEDGCREIVEKALEAYGLVVSGKQAPETLLANRMDICRLENQIRTFDTILRFCLYFIDFIGDKNGH